MRGQVMVRWTIVCNSPTRCRPRYPLEPIFILPRTFCHFHVLVVCLRVRTAVRVFEEAAVYITKVDKLDIWRDGAEVKGGYFDRANKGGSLGYCELAVEDVDEGGS
jgi:hypothetical protein